MSLIEFGKPIEKLIETVSAAIGVLYRPTAIRKEAEAKAYEIVRIAEADAQVAIIKHDSDLEIANRVNQRLIHQETVRQNNLDSIVAKSAGYLPGSASEEPVNVDWRARFFNRAQDVSTEEMQEIWAKILANEVASPGAISLRTMDVVANLSPKEAQLFNVACQLSFDNLRVLRTRHGDLERFGLTYDDILLLRYAGLIHDNDALTVIYSYIDEIGGAIIRVEDRKVLKVWQEGSTTPIQFGQLKFTPAGEEICRIIQPKMNTEYLAFFIENKKDEGLRFEEIRMKNLNGE
ncbi:MAG TPA: DUF2806 domain-containing protein [Chryseolinea sp.]